MIFYELQPDPALPEDHTPGLSLIVNEAPEGAFFEDELLQVVNEPDKWPQLSFEISDQNIFGGSLPTSPDNRLRSAVRTLEAAVPSLIKSPLAVRKNDTGDPIPLSPAEFCKEVRKKLDTYLNKTVPVNRSRTARRNFVSEPELMHMYTDEYRASNHPVIQLMEELAFRNQEREDQSAAHPGRKVRVLSPGEMDKLCDGLIIVAEGTRLVETAQQQVANKLAQLAALLAIHHTIHPYEL